MKLMMEDVALVNSFGERGFYPFCAPAVLDWIERSQLVAQPVNQSHLWHQPFPI